MRAFVIFATLIVAAVARPDIGLQLQQQGYNYQTPGSSGGGGSSFSQGGNGGQSSFQGSSSSGFGGGSSGSGNFGQSSGFGGSQGSSGGGSSGGGFDVRGSGFGSSSGSSSGSGSNFGQSSGQGFGGGSSQGFGGSSGGFGGGGGAQYSGGEVIHGQSKFIDLGGPAQGGVQIKHVVRQGEPQITRSFYIHEAPEEHVDQRVEEKVHTIRPQKNYKIIFIKTPTQSAAERAQSQIQYPANEEKTIVYVLSKKNDGLNDDGSFATPPPPVTSKPEVFFVKYKTKEEAEQAVSKIQDSFQEGGEGYNSPDSFAKSLGATTGGGASSFSQGSRSSQGSSQGFGSSSGSSQGFGGSSGSSGSSQGFGGSSGGSSGGGHQSFQTSQQSFGGGGSQGFGGAVASQSHSPSRGSFQQTQTSSSFSGGDNNLIPQQMIQIPHDQSAFQSEYLPPRK